MEANKIKKRAARACSFCRGRKVRCIVTGPSEACTNCKYHEKPCTRTGICPQSPAAYSETASTPRSCSITSYQDSVRPTADGAPALDTATTPISLDKQRLYSQSSSYTSDINVAKTPLTLAGTIDLSKPSSLSLPGPPPAALSETQVRSTRPSCHPTYSFLRTPDFNGILSQDLTFLISQGCFMVPQRAVLDEFVEQYFRHVHPMLPLLSEADVCRTYKLGDPDCVEEDKMSILVLHGILFTSCNFVSLDTLSALGFQTYQEAKWAFYRRAKLLYDFGCESSAITKAQGALLLAQSHLIPRPLAGNTPFGSIWLSVAIHFAREANAHRYASSLPDDCPDPERARKHQNVLKRLWWCCIICDRVFPLSSRRDIKITKANFDFYSHPILASEDLDDEMYMSSVYSPTTKALLAQVMQKYVELCIVLTDVLTVTSVLHNHPTWGNTTSAEKLNSSKDQLQQWHSSWSGLRDTVEERCSKEGVAGSSNGSITMFAKLLDMYYYSARQALCHSEILQYSIAGSPCLLPYALEKSDELQSANSRVTECLVELNNSRSTRWLPMTAIGCTALPLALHLIDAELLRQDDEQGPCSDTVTLFANYKRSRLMNLSEAMDTYRPKYYIVDWVVKAVWHIVHLARQFLSSMAVQNGVMGLSPTSWTELLQLMPSSYLRLVITLEMSISHGKLPEEGDFPPTLRTSAEISFSIPNMSKYLEFDTAPRQSSEKDRTEEQEDRRVTEVVDEGAGFSTNFDFNTAMDSLGDDLVFQTPRTHQHDKVAAEVVNPAPEPPPPMASTAMDTSTGLDAFDGTFQGEDEFDEWANRVLGLDSGFL